MVTYIFSFFFSLVERNLLRVKKFLSVAKIAWHTKGKIVSLRCNLLIETVSRTISLVNSSVSFSNKSDRTSTQWLTLSTQQIESTLFAEGYDSSLLMWNLSLRCSSLADIENHCRSNLQQEACQNEAQETYPSQTHPRREYENRLFLQQQTVWTNLWC